MTIKLIPYSTFVSALELIAAVTSELAKGTKHYSQDGTPLLTPLEVLTALNRDGTIILEALPDEEARPIPE